MSWQALDTLLSSEASSRRLSLRRATLFSAVMSVIGCGFWWYKTLTRTTWPPSAPAASNCQVNTVTAHTGEFHQGLVVSCLAFPPAYQPPVIVQPAEEPLDLPPALVAPQRTAILGLPAVATVGCDHFHPALPEFLVELVAVIGAVSYQPFRQHLDEHEVEQQLDQTHFCPLSAFRADGDRKTMAVDHCHDLDPLALAGVANSIAPFFAEAKVASTKHSLTSSLPRSRRSSAKARNRPRMTPCCSHSWNRRWTVW